MNSGYEEFKKDLEKYGHFNANITSTVDNKIAIIPVNGETHDLIKKFQHDPKFEYIKTNKNDNVDRAIYDILKEGVKQYTLFLHN